MVRHDPDGLTQGRTCISGKAPGRKLHEPSLLHQGTGLPEAYASMLQRKDVPDMGHAQEGASCHG